jgi:hypothetical protein
MKIVTNCLSYGRSCATAAKEHVQKHGKIYLVGLAILAATGLAVAIRANVMPIEVFRVAGGRRLATDDPMALHTTRFLDPSPYFRRLAAYINSRDESQIF